MKSYRLTQSNHNDESIFGHPTMRIPVGDTVTFFSKDFLSFPLIINNGSGLYQIISDNKLNELYSIESLESGFIFVSVVMAGENLQTFE